MSALRIGIDGYNLALPRGTGVATYGRNLAAAVSSLGHPVDLMFGLNIPRKVRADLRETLFFGRLPDPDPQKLTWRRLVRRATVPPWAQDMIEVPVSGRVIARGADEQLPAFDRLFNLSEIFQVCARHFRRYGRFMTLRVPDPPAIMHWTYPLPIQLAGAQNVYTLHDLVPLKLRTLASRTSATTMRWCAVASIARPTSSRCPRRRAPTSSRCSAPIRRTSRTAIRRAPCRRHAIPPVSPTG